MTDPDEDLIRAFRALKGTDEQAAPSFAIPTRRRRWHPRVGVLAASAVTVACACLLVLQLRSNPPDERAAPRIAFEQLSEVISRELFVASADEWHSPTEFLLHDPTQPNESDK